MILKEALWPAEVEVPELDALLRLAVKVKITTVGKFEILEVSDAAGLSQDNGKFEVLEVSDAAGLSQDKMKVLT